MAERRGGISTSLILCSTTSRWLRKIGEVFKWFEISSMTSQLHPVGPKVCEVYIPEIVGEDVLVEGHVAGVVEHRRRSSLQSLSGLLQALRDACVWMRTRGWQFDGVE
jgi:hypothetical protein